MTQFKTALYLILVLAFLFTGCTGQKIKPFTTGDGVRAETQGEERLWASAEKLDSALKKSGLIYQDKTLVFYLQGIMDRLYPEFKGKIHVQLIKDPSLNAFTLPNGSIHVHIGLICALENEAQIASVLAHEGIHFTQKHAALQRDHMHTAIRASMAVSLIGVPFFPKLIATSSIFGYSREHEHQADEMGYQRLINTGYDAQEAVKAFKILLLEAKAEKEESPLFFSSHPSLEERIKNFTELSKGFENDNQLIGFEPYQKHVADIRSFVLEEKLKSGKYASVIASLTNEKIQKLQYENMFYYLGEAYRLRGEPGDNDKALSAYLKAAHQNPDFVATYKSIGIINLKKGNYSQARAYFIKYMKINPGSCDEGFIQYYLKRIDKNEAVE
ncbi:MAG: M48 family metalloprotease [Desulfobacteraceae bacterium]|nr:M48 family metalloprotease [Desulfobacteraceae bacterium]